MPTPLLKQWVFFNAFSNEVLNAVGLRGQIYYIYYKHSSPKDHFKTVLNDNHLAIINALPSKGKFRDSPRSGIGSGSFQIAGGSPVP
ncbi:hypothetical protein [Riemerella anatipestifer]|uniref:hypothetical protein n=1 Tax=Riemerella anatipestifer TaxID=34085 RepID=UPI00129EBA89|nr:hypothetical protein [Riemerella anatipestifer]